MRIIHGRGFSEEERKTFAKLIFQNIFTAIKAMTGAMTMLKIPYANPENEVNSGMSYSELHLRQHRETRRVFCEQFYSTIQMVAQMC